MKKNISQKDTRKDSEKNSNVAEEDNKKASDEADIVKELQKELEEEKNKNNELTEKLYRIAAESENYKKRVDKEISEFRKFANQELIKKLLDAIDNLERAMEASKDEEKTPLFEGIQMTYKQCVNILESFGVKKIDALDQKFDPNFHQAMLTEECEDKEEGIILKEMQKGYLLHDRLIRPSLVVISKGC